MDKKGVEEFCCLLLNVGAVSRKDSFIVADLSGEERVLLFSFLFFWVIYLMIFHITKCLFDQTI